MQQLKFKIINVIGITWNLEVKALTLRKINFFLLNAIYL